MQYLTVFKALLESISSEHQLGMKFVQKFHTATPRRVQTYL